MALRLWNTLSGRKEVFEPFVPAKVSFYVCGPTVYDDVHVGNARSAVVFDAIRKHLTFCGYTVRFVMNVTDVDDKIIHRAQKEKKDWRAIAEHYTQNYRKVLEALQVAPPDVQPKATEHIGEMIELIEKLIARGKAYVAGADVFFHTPSFPSYGKLSKKNLEEMMDGARVEPHPAKRHPADFSLWKAAKPDEPVWDSPWGKGRPGWHIECSAMARAHLGGCVDIHGGGVDLIFPHHENEIAQCEAAFDEPFVKYWLHNGFLEMGGRKMSKSLGNIQKAKDVLARFSGEALRAFFLSAHYRSPLVYEEEALQAMKAGLDEFTRTLWRLPEGKISIGEEGNAHPLAEKVQTAPERIQEAMDDDFNTPRALAVLFDLARECRRVLAEPQNEAASAALREARKVLENFGRHFGLLPSDRGGVPSDVLTLAEERSRKKKEKDFRAADRLREEILKKGYFVEDGPDGSYRILPRG